jgi:hypothetical protein
VRKFKEGERVRVTDRNATPADTKSGLFYNYYRNLTGTIFKLYGTGESAQAAIEVDLASLPAEVAKRHQEMQEAICASEPRWRNNNNTRPEFPLRYVLLLSVSDLLRETARRQS